MKEIPGYILACAFGVVATYLYNSCENDKVYIDYSNRTYHRSEVCDSIHGFDKGFLEEFGEVTGSKKIDEKKVYGDQNYKMCEHCFSQMEILHHNDYIINIQK